MDAILMSHHLMGTSVTYSNVFVHRPVCTRVFFCSNALIALARSLCKCLLAQLITGSGANAVKGYLVRCACIDGTIP